jgi:hypothetical protein
VKRRICHDETKEEGVMDNTRLTEAQRELMRHSWDTFVADPPPSAKRGSVVPGCPTCRKIIYTDNQYLSHLALDVLPGILEKVTAESV